MQGCRSSVSGDKPNATTASFLSRRWLTMGKAICPSAAPLHELRQPSDRCGREPEPFDSEAAA